MEPIKASVRSGRVGLGGDDYDKKKENFKIKIETETEHKVSNWHKLSKNNDDFTTYLKKV